MIATQQISQLLPIGLGSHREDNHQQLFDIQSLTTSAYCNIKGERQAKRDPLYYIIWIKEGEGELLIDTKKHKLKENTFYCIRPKQIQMISSQALLRGDVVSFSPDFLGLNPNSFNPLFSGGLFGPSGEGAVVSMGEQETTQLNHIICNMYKEHASNSAFKMEILKEYLKLFLIYLTRHTTHIEQRQNQNGSEVVNRFFSLLQRNYKCKKLACEYADLLAISPNRLNNLVKRISGNPVSFHIQQQVIQEAKRLAIYTDKSMKEIAYHLGFEADAHFSRFFKNMAGHNFRQFRKDHASQLYA